MGARNSVAQGHDAEFQRGPSPPPPAQIGLPGDSDEVLSPMSFKASVPSNSWVRTPSPAGSVFKGVKLTDLAGDSELGENDPHLVHDPQLAGLPKMRSQTHLSLTSSVASSFSAVSFTVGEHGEVHLGRVLMPSASLVAVTGLSQDDMTGTAWTAYISFVLTCLGSSILTVPWIMGQSGGVLGFMVLTMPALVSTGSVRWLVRLGVSSNLLSYQEIMSKYIGRVGDTLTFVTLNATIFLVSSSCCAIVSEVVPTLAHELNRFSQFQVSLIIAALCAPLAGAKTLVILHKFVSCGFLACIGLVALIVCRAAEDRSIHPSASQVRLTEMLPWSVALSNACFGVEMSVLAVMQEIKPEFRHRVVRSADLALLTCVLLYSAAGLAAYAQYGASVKPNILVSFGVDWWSKIAKILLIAVNLARVPVFTFLQRDLASTKSGVVQGLHRQPDRWLSRGTFGALHVLASAMIGCTLASAGRALGIAGGTVGIAINVGLPALAWCLARRRGEVGAHYALDALAVISLIMVPVFLVMFAVSFVRNFGNV